MRIAFIGNALPRRCGIATFTTDLELAVRHGDDVAATAIIAMCDPGGHYDYPPHVRATIAQDDPGDYLAAAEFINGQGFDVACLQHEFGIFGGEAGSMVLGLNDALVELTGTQGVELLMWLTARGALPGDVNKVHSNYHVPISNTATGLMVLESI